MSRGGQEAERQAPGPGGDGSSGGAGATGAAHGDTGQGRPSTFERILPWAILGVFLLIAAVGSWIVAVPGSPGHEFVSQISALTLPPESAVSDEYLVFLEEDTPANRKRLFAAAANISFVAESLLPDVVVVKIPDRIIATLQTLREQEFVNMVFKYSAALGCH